MAASDETLYQIEITYRFFSNRCTLLTVMRVTCTRLLYIGLVKSTLSNIMDSQHHVFNSIYVVRRDGLGMYWHKIDTVPPVRYDSAALSNRKQAKQVHHYDPWRSIWTNSHIVCTPAMSIYCDATSLGVLRIGTTRSRASRMGQL